jgi:uncharacterized DUF497 family protein
MLLTRDWYPAPSEPGESRKTRRFVEVAAEVFDDANRLVEPDYTADGEERLSAIGRAGQNLLILIVAYTERNTNGEETIRIISARKASKKEPSRYSSLR